jgi:hypothetical protein
MHRLTSFRNAPLLLTTCALLTCFVAHTTPGPLAAHGGDSPNRFNDVHFHLRHYLQQGIEATQFLEIPGRPLPRSTLLGIPLQQQWSNANAGNIAPAHYLHPDTPRHYCSFTDACIASVYRALPQSAQVRSDDDGFNPSHIDGAVLRGLDRWAPVWKPLTSEASYRVRTGNDARILDGGRRRVRACEAAT